MKYKIFFESGVVADVKQKKLSLEQMQDIVGGYIEIVNIGRGSVIVDEEGLLKGKKENPFWKGQFVGTVIEEMKGA